MMQRRMFMVIIHMFLVVSVIFSQRICYSEGILGVLEVDTALPSVELGGVEVTAIDPPAGCKLRAIKARELVERLGAAG